MFVPVYFVGIMAVAALRNEHNIVAVLSDDNSCANVLANCLKLRVNTFISLFMPLFFDCLIN